MSTYTLKGHDTTPVVNYHFNRDFYMQVDQYLAGNSKMLNPRERQFTRNYRHFYIVDGDNVWSANYRPLCTPSDEYVCEFNPESTEIISKKDGLISRIRVFVPVEGDFEVWTHRVVNDSQEVKELTIIPAMSLEFGPMGSICRHDADHNLIYSRVYPYHIKYSEWETVSNQTNYCYYYSDTKYDSYDTGERHFYASDYVYDMPVAVKNKKCSNNATAQDNPIAAFCYKVTLKPGEEFSYNLYGGGSIHKDQIIDRIDNIFSKFDVEAELQKAKEYYDANASIFTVETPHKEFDDYVNTWVKKQILAMVITNRCAKSTCVRNQLQDALGYGLFNKDAENYFSDVISLQQTNGFLRQHHVVNNAYPISGLGLLTMTDGTSWMVNCTAMYCNATKNYDYLNVVLPYKEGGEATVAEHLILGCEYMWNDRGMYGL
ncbi:MAG: hypothetical protein IKD20_01155, partial [Clostridia bacterium]|nr:hypothetical protein [Clostridia bacterium]